MNIKHVINDLCLADKAHAAGQYRAAAHMALFAARMALACRSKRRIDVARDALKLASRCEYHLGKGTHAEKSEAGRIRAEWSALCRRCDVQRQAMRREEEAATD